MLQTAYIREHKALIVERLKKRNFDGEFYVQITWGGEFVGRRSRSSLSVIYIQDLHKLAALRLLQVCFTESPGREWKLLGISLACHLWLSWGRHFGGLLGSNLELQKCQKT